MLGERSRQLAMPIADRTLRERIRRNDLWYGLPTLGCRQRRGRAMLMADLVGLSTFIIV